LILFLENILPVDKFELGGLAAKDVISIGALAIAFLALFVAPFINSRNSRRQTIAPNAASVDK
jgi:hypothetical protein